MIRDDLDGLDDTRHDVCVIGSGPAGVTLALEFARLGRTVLVLESGGDGPEPAAQALSDAELVDPARHDSMAIAVARRLGGTSNLWGGRCLPFDPIDYETRPVTGGVTWPIGHDDVAPFLPRAVEIARAGQPVFSDPALREPGGDFTLSTLERWSARRQSQIAHRAALASDPRIDVRLHATVCGFDWDGETLRALRVARPDGSVRRIPVRVAILANGGLESTRLLLADRAEAPARHGGPNGALGRTYMGHVIGEIADIVFTDTALESAFAFRIDAHGSYSRPRFVTAAETQRRDGLLNCALWPVVPRISDPRHRSGFLSAIALALSVEPVGRRLIAEAIRKRHIPDGMARAPHLANLLRDLPRTAASVPRLLWNRFGAAIPAPGFFELNKGHRYGLAYHAEQKPDGASRVDLAGERDATGLPRLRIDLRFCDDDARSVVRTHERLDTWLRQTGIGALAWRHPPETREAAVLAQASHGTHQIGTARMAATATGGVVDGDLRVFGTDNLYIASSAVLPTSGQANPTLTVMALAARLADHLGRTSPTAVHEQRVCEAH